MKRTWTMAAALMLAACGAKTDLGLMQGYGEADYIYLSAQDGGVISDVLVKEGDQIAEGQQIFRLDPDRIGYAAENASASRSALAEAVRAAESDAALARQNLSRARELSQQGFYPRATLDANIAANDAAQARLAQARRALSAASAESQLAARRVEDLQGASPTSGVVQRVYHRGGEVVAAGQPIVSILAPQNMKVRFFAPEALLPRLKVGDTVNISCDNCAPNLEARISFIADQPQFTPPVIYSLKERDKLVYLIEARPADPAAIHPGQPIDVRLPEPAP